MEHIYYGLAGAGFLGLLAWFYLKKTCHGSIPPSRIIQPSSEPTEKISSSSTPVSEEKTKQATKNKQKTSDIEGVRMKKLEQLESEYQGIYFGSFRLKAQNSIHSITALDFKGSKLLVSTSKNEIDLFNLKNWKKDNKQSNPERFYVSLDNNGASAVCIGQRYYYAALTFDKTIVYYEFKGESGIYFREVAKFQRNILKSNASAIHVSKNETYIITAGSGADTVVDVWSMKGQKLASMNSFQIEHYSICFGLKSVLIRGWTSEVKILNSVEQKDGSFKKMEKYQHLAHEQSPLQSAICNRDMYAVTITKHHKVRLWNLLETGLQRTSDHSQTPTGYSINKCALYTFEPLVGHFKTVAVLGHNNGFIVTDMQLKIIHRVDGIEVKSMYMNGTPKSVILGTVNSQFQVSLWNLTKLLQNVEEVKM